MTTRFAWAVVAVVTAALASLYGAVLLWLAQNPVFLPANTFETVILGSQIIRLAVVLSIGRLRRMNGIIIIDLFAAEVLLIPVLGVVEVLLGNGQYLPLAGNLLWAWTSSFLLVFPTFAMYKVIAMIRRGASLTALVPTATSLFAVLALVLSATKQTTKITGLTGMTKLVLSTLTQGATVAAADPIVLVAGAVLYLGLIVYSTMGAEGAPPVGDLLLVFSAVGSALALLWGLVVSEFTADTFLIFGAPSIVLIAIMWLGSREN